MNHFIRYANIEYVDPGLRMINYIRQEAVVIWRKLNGTNIPYRDASYSVK
jgi:hypothetical protein